jgi:hypothetical protein
MAWFLNTGTSLDFETSFLHLGAHVKRPLFALELGFENISFHRNSRKNTVFGDLLLPQNH